jgi:hypothetical protein
MAGRNAFARGRDMLSSPPRDLLGKISKLSRIRVADVANAMPDRLANFMKHDPLRRAWTPEA